MNLDTELRELFGRGDETPWPGEATAYDRFLRRRARRGRAVAGATGLALVAILAGAVLVSRLHPSDQPPVAPAPDTVRVESQGWELPLPAGWRVERKLRGTRVYQPGEVLPGTPVGRPVPAVVGLVLAPRSGGPSDATITISTEDELVEQERFDPAAVRGGSRRPDGRDYRLHPGAGPGAVGRYLVFWPDFCSTWAGCSGASAPRVLAVTGSAGAGGEQVLQVMETIVRTLRPITNSVPPPKQPPAPAVAATTTVLLGAGGSGREAWELWIEPLDGNPGFAVHFPWLERRRGDRGGHWEQLEPGMIQRNGTYTLLDCISWVPGSGVLLTGLARQDVASIRFELAGQAPVTVPTIRDDERIPWVAYASPKLPAGTRLERVLALDAAGKLVGGEERPYDGDPLCRPSSP
jgi:hypothetical protein